MIMNQHLCMSERQRALDLTTQFAALLRVDRHDPCWQSAGSAEVRQCIVALRRGALWLFLGCEPMLQLRLPSTTPIGAEQLLHFPQPALSPAEAMDCDDACSDGGFALSPDETDNQFGPPRRGGTGAHVHKPVCTVADLGSIVHLSHACGSSVLVHFGCGANAQVTVEPQGHTELVCKCLAALHSVLLPQQAAELLRAYHACATCAYAWLL